MYVGNWYFVSKVALELIIDPLYNGKMWGLTVQKGQALKYVSDKIINTKLWLPCVIF